MPSKILKRCILRIYTMMLLASCGLHLPKATVRSKAVVVHTAFRLRAMGQYNEDSIPKKFLPAFPNTVIKRPVPARLMGSRMYTCWRAIAMGGVNLVYAVGVKDNRRHFWIYTRDWQNLGPIEGLPTAGRNGMEMFWDQHTRRLILLLNGRANEPGNFNGFTVGYLSAASRLYREIYHKTKSSASAYICDTSLYLFELTDDPGVFTIRRLNLQTLRVSRVYREITNHSGHEQPMLVVPSPDGHLLAFDRLNPYPSEGCGIWIFNTRTSICQQVTFGNRKHYYHNLLGWKSSRSLYFYDVFHGTVYELTLLP